MDMAEAIRTPERTLVAHPGLDVLKLSRFDIGVPLVRPYVRARFRR